MLIGKLVVTYPALCIPVFFVFPMFLLGKAMPRLSLLPSPRKLLWEVLGSRATSMCSCSGPASHFASKCAFWVCPSRFLLVVVLEKV